ncbi:MAG: class I SAM-dependent methyltransferase, partial [Gammaproteobacteria bacterium]|nr:class I SAM-dependent methyltransferase [Gammaproteobacteria bacterium]
QWQYATDKVVELRLTDKVEVLKKDYRDLSGQYDKLVSVEMIEAVGHQYLDRFIGVCDQRLKVGGLMLLQAITVPDDDYQQMIKGVDFIKKYIFPGGFLPSVAAIKQATSITNSLQLVSQKKIGQHYARTLADWRYRFESSIDDIKRLGFDDHFIRMWRFYFCYCEGGFHEQSIDDQQLLFEKTE